MNKTVLKEKVLPALQIIVALAVIIVSGLGLAGVIEHASRITTPLLGVLLIVQGASFWEKRKGIAIFDLCGGAFILICSVIILIVM